MRLNDAVIENMFDANDNDLTSAKKFVSALKESVVMADVFFNGYKAFTSPLRFREVSGYLSASVDGRFSFSPEVELDNILIRAHYLNDNDVLFQSYTSGLSFPVDLGDYDADLFFTVMSTCAANRLKPSTAESRISHLATSNFKPIDLSAQEEANSDIDVDDDDSQVTVNVTGVLFTITQRENDNSDIYHFWLTGDDLPDTEVDCAVTFDFGNDDTVTVHNTTVGEEIYIVKGMEGWSSLHSSLGNTITLHVVCDELGINCSLEKELTVE